MKIEMIDEDNFIVYLTIDAFLEKENESYIDMENEDKIKKFLKNIVLRLKKKLKNNFFGYYMLTAYKAYNVFVLEFERLDEYHIGVELNIVLYLNSKIFFKYEEPTLIKPDYYYDGYFYKKIDAVFDSLKYIEFGGFVYDEEVDKLIEKGTCLSD
ncbi:MAG: hypothetical protein HFG48_01715 [Bacilli bacterium]|nr:hypothetical protein [Bacilli bacterium]